MSSYLQSLSYFFRLPFHIQWRTALVQLPRYVPLSILLFTSRKGPQPFMIALPSRKNHSIPIYVFFPPNPVELEGSSMVHGEEWKVPVVLDFHGGGFIMGSPLEQAPYAAMMSRELGAIVVSVSYRIGPFHQFPAAIHDAEDTLSAILDVDGVSKAGNVLRTEIQRYYDSMRDAVLKKEKPDAAPHFKRVSKITLDPTHLSISGFSAGGNIALNMALSVPPCADILSGASIMQSPKPANSHSDLFSPLLPPSRAPTALDDPAESWPTILPPPQAQPRMLPLLLFYPSLDARLLPHERPMKPMPNALKGDDKEEQKPKMPGLFSIMGPTYLPKKLRAHPRASPGLVDPSNIHKNASIFLVLPENDSLAVQSDVWVDVMKSAGWKGPVRFGDQRASDWNGRDNEAVAPDSSRSQSHEDSGGLEVWHAPECRHGWTQFPEAFLGQHEKQERFLVFNRTLQFVKEQWSREVPVAEAGNQVQELRPLEIPGQEESRVA